MAGVDLGPSAIRVAGLADRISQLGYDVLDLDDLEIERPRSRPKPGEKLKYLVEIHDACERLATEGRGIVEAGVRPMTIGGYPSMRVGLVAGEVKSLCRPNAVSGWFYF